MTVINFECVTDIAMDQRATGTNPLFLLSGAVRRDPGVLGWFNTPDQEIRRLAQPWFEQVRSCGSDVFELLHDGHPTACVQGAAFAYIDAFSAHANLGFFPGAALVDPDGLLVGSGKRMRHIKIHRGEPVNEEAIRALITGAYRDIRLRLQVE